MGPLAQVLAVVTLAIGCTNGAAEVQAPSAKPLVSAASPSKVVVSGQKGRWQLTRNGEPYFIRGAGGDVHLEKIVAAGGNSVRTWGTNQLGQILDKAHEQGLTVTAGLWLGHERHGFKYDDQQAVLRQREVALTAVEKYKNHPALLMWGIGNEMEAKGDNPLIWREINEIAEKIKAIDPNHPTMTVLAGAGDVKLKNLKVLCPAIDVLGVNAYGGLRVLPQRLQEAGWEKPYVVTEFGPPGPWESGKTAWGAPIELSSTQKAEIYERNYRLAIESQRAACFGSYAFRWGQKQEATSTWFGMLLPSGETLAAVDAMTTVWTGKAPSHLAPHVQALSLKSAAGNALENQTTLAGTSLLASLEVESPNQYPLTIRWDLREESSDRKSGGDKEAEPPAWPLTVRQENSKTLTFAAPTKPGPYRLFVYVLDGKGKAATANVPFLVKPAE